MTNECPHGQLRRQCPLCERDATIAELRERLEKIMAIAGNMDYHGRVLDNRYLRGIASDLMQIAELAKESK